MIAARPRRKLHYVYFVLAAFDVMAVCAGLYLSHSIMTIYVDSVAVHQAWAERAYSYSRLGELAAAVNAPGNEVFKSRDPLGEARRTMAALDAFEDTFQKLRADLKKELPAPHAQSLLARLDAVDAHMLGMAGEARVIFLTYRAHDPRVAGERMASMDRYFSEVNRELAELREDIASIQRANFSEHLAAADRRQRYEYLIGVAILFMVTFATAFGLRLARQAQEDERRLQALLGRTLEAHEAERQHIAHELHEDVAQTLASLRMRLGAPTMQAAGALVQSALRRLQDLAQNLAPHGMQHVGLAPVLDAHLREWTRGSGLVVDFAERPVGARAPLAVETAAYRVAEEAVANVVQHAHARVLHVELVQEASELRLSVADDGTGFDLSEAGRKASGLNLMEQRAALLGGRVEIASQPDQGTKIQAVFPT